MNPFNNVSLPDFDKSVNQILQCQENLLKLESISTEIQSALIKTLLAEIDLLEGSLIC